MTKLFKRALYKAKEIKNKIFGYEILYNVNNDNTIDKKRALFVYQVEPFKIDINKSLFYSHHSMKQAKQIAQVLGNNGFVVDVADYREKSIRSKYKYDLLLSHSVKINYNNLLNNNCIKVYLSSGENHKLHNFKINERYEALFKRRGVKIIPKRLADINMPYLKEVDFIIGFGNKFILDSWQKEFKVLAFPFNNYGYEETKYFYNDKNFDEAKNKFLFFSGGDMVWKGLDLLLEVFSTIQKAELYICSELSYETDFAKLYRKELKLKNIHYEGYIVPNSQKYEEVIKKCAYIIYPSTSEGQPGSVVQCMYSGLIPIISKHCGLDINECGITLNDCSIPEIEKVISDVISFDAEWHKSQSMQTRKLCENFYSEEHFINTWDRILKSIL